MSKTVIITGASQGIGKLTALKFKEQGYNVIAVSRSISKSQELKSKGIDLYDMDISDTNSVELAFYKIFSKYPQIDILINNAGFSQNGFIEELSIDQLRYQFEVNVFGLIKVTQMVLPSMRKARKGKIINIGSIGGDFTSPGASAYHASKYAIESFTDGLRQELKAFGIDVILIKPGGVATDFTANSRSNYPNPIKGNPYEIQRKKYNEMLDKILDPSKSSFALLTPYKVVSVIIEAINDSKPKTRYRIGSAAKMILLMKRLMSDRSFDNMLLKQLKLN
ncbi:oxidoreductase [Flavihumibacter cheonanensis]|uniref:SDR family NAD(P)-dependent oxidoreductase n=1 Tax=Flavihumibacter cheonanensis TaxID=1442385 RepID=UPI001EF86EF3|nr:SDR family NAD(P)-dependent oxidoreductase [Flavihumibacter cheonanensis]MCG7753133.1 SDR family NAD(P)-dependent oxidoreductase [Flavihumibacter cheonanensis]